MQENLRLKYDQTGDHIILGYPCYGLTSKETREYYQRLKRSNDNSKRFWQLNEKVNKEIQRLKDLESSLNA